MVINSSAKETKQSLVEQFFSSLIRFYYGGDLLDNEMGVVFKSAIGIVVDMLGGLNKTALKSALMSCGVCEVAWLVEAMGGNEISAYGLAHLGDYQVTVFSPYNHNYAFGECFVKGKHYDELVEGVVTTRAMLRLRERYDVELPVCQVVEAVIHGRQTTGKVLPDLFLRSQKAES